MAIDAQKVISDLMTIEDEKERLGRYEGARSKLRSRGLDVEMIDKAVNYTSFMEFKARAKDALRFPGKVFEKSMAGLVQLERPQRALFNVGIGKINLLRDTANEWEKMGSDYETVIEKAKNGEITRDQANERINEIKHRLSTKHPWTERRKNELKDAYEGFMLKGKETGESPTGYKLVEAMTGKPKEEQNAGLKALAWFFEIGADPLILIGEVFKPTQYIGKGIKGIEAVARAPVEKAGMARKAKTLAKVEGVGEEVKKVSEQMAKTKGLRETPTTALTPDDVKEIRSIEKFVKDPQKEVIQGIKKEVKKIIDKIEGARGEMPPVQKTKPGYEYIRKREAVKKGNEWTKRYSEVANNMAVYLSAYSRGEIARATLTKRMNELLKEVGVKQFEARRLTELGIQDYPSRVFQRIAVEEPKRWASIIDDLKLFRQTNQRNIYTRALGNIDRSKAASQWKDAAESGNRMLTKKEIRGFFKRNTEFKKYGDVKKQLDAILDQVYGVRKIGDLTAEEAKTLDYFMQRTKLGRLGKVKFPDLEFVADGNFYKTVNMAEPTYFDRVFKTFFGSPEIVFKKMGLSNVWKLYKQRYDKLIDHQIALFDELRVIQQEASGVDNSGQIIFDALNKLDETKLTPLEIKVIERLKKTDKVTIPEPIRLIVTNIREKQIVDIPETLKPAARRIYGIYDELADAQKLPWSSRYVNYATNLVKDTFVKDLVDAGVIKQGEKVSEDLIRKLDNDGKIPTRLRHIAQYIFPTEIRHGFLKSRTPGEKEYLVRDIWTALNAYVPAAMKRIYYNDPYKLARNSMKSLENAGVDSTFAEEYLRIFNDNIRGLTYFGGLRMKKGAPESRLLYGLSNNIFLGALGAAPDSSLKNLMQGTNTISEIGLSPTLRGYRKLSTKEGLSILEKSGVLREAQIKKLAEVGAEKGIFRGAPQRAYEKVSDVLMIPFGSAEFINRGSAYLGAYYKYFDEPVAGFRNADDYAKSIVRKTQFDYTPVDLALGLQSPFGRTFFQFWTFPSKQTELINSWMGNKEWDKLRRYMIITFGALKVGELTGVQTENFLATGMVPIRPNFFEGGYDFMMSPIPAMGINTMMLLGSMLQEKQIAPWRLQSDRGKLAFESAKKQDAMLIPGGRFGKKLLDTVVTVARGGEEYSQYGRIDDPILKPAQQTPKDVKSGWEIAGRLFGIYGDRRVEEIKESSRAQLAGTAVDEKRRIIYGSIQNYLDTEDKRQLKRAAMFSKNLGLPLSEFLKSDKGFKKKMDQYRRASRAKHVERVLMLFAKGQSKQAFGRMKLLGMDSDETGVKNKEIKSYMRKLWKQGAEDNYFRELYNSLENQFPNAALTEEEKMGSILGAK